MEDGETTLGIFEFAPQRVGDQIRDHFIYITNGMAERRMPCETEPHGNPAIRAEILIYTRDAWPLGLEIMTQLAHYPFVMRCGLAEFQTMPLDVPGLPWSGLMFIRPICLDSEFDPQLMYVEPVSDVTVFLQVLGLKRDELNYAVEHGGEKFYEDTLGKAATSRNAWSMLLFDHDRRSLLQ